MASDEEIFANIATVHDLGERLSSEQSGLITIALGEWSTRFAVRVVLSHGEKIALQSMPESLVTKIPGGGQRAGESREQTVRRELAEEVGLAPDVLQPLGTIIEYRSKWRLLQMSTCYWAELPSLEQAAPPTEEGSRLLWADDGEEALRMIISSEGLPSNSYDRSFAIARDVNLIRYYLGMFTSTQANLKESATS